MKSLTAAERRLGAILSHAVLVALGLVSLLMSTLENGWHQFQYYTQDSNYFSLCVSVAFLIAACRRRREDPLPQWLLTLRYLATCLLTVTFLVITLVLAPPYGWLGYRVTLFTGAMSFQHLLCPVLSFVSFFLFEDCPRGRHLPLLALIPTVLYAVVSTLLNAARVLHGPYPFLYVYEQPWWQSVIYAVVIIGGAYLVAFFLLLFKRKADR